MTTKNQVQQQSRRPNSNFQNCADGTVEERNSSTTTKKPLYPWDQSLRGKQWRQKAAGEGGGGTTTMLRQTLSKRHSYQSDSLSWFRNPTSATSRGKTEEKGATGPRRKAKPPDKILKYQKTRARACAKWECASKEKHSPNTQKLMVRLQQKPRSKKKRVEEYQKFAGGQPTMNWPYPKQKTTHRRRKARVPTRDNRTNCTKVSKNHRKNTLPLVTPQVRRGSVTYVNTSRIQSTPTSENQGEDSSLSTRHESGGGGPCQPTNNQLDSDTPHHSKSKI